MHALTMPHAHSTWSTHMHARTHANTHTLSFSLICPSHCVLLTLLLLLLPGAEDGQGRAWAAACVPAGVDAGATPQRSGGTGTRAQHDHTHRYRGLSLCLSSAQRSVGASPCVIVACTLGILAFPTVSLGMVTDAPDYWAAALCQVLCTPVQLTPGHGDLT